MPRDAGGTTSAVPIALGRLLVFCVALLSAGAGVIHLGVAGQHFAHPLLVAGFLGMGVSQIALAGGLVMRGSRALLWGAAAVHLSIIGLWAATRATAVPFVPGLEAVQPIGIADVTATMLEVAVVAVIGISLATPAAARAAMVPAGQRILAGVGGGVVLLAIPGLIAPHSHGSHTRGTAAHAAAHAPGSDGHGHTGMTWDGARHVLAPHGHDRATDRGTSTHGHGADGATAAAAHGHGETAGPASGHPHPSGAAPHGKHEAGAAHEADVGHEARPEREIVRFPQGKYLAYEPATSDGHGSAFRWHDGGGPGHHAYAGECRPTAQQQAAGDEIAARTSAALAKYNNNPWRALRDGFVAYPIPVWKMFHMVGGGRLEDDHVLDAERIESFLYMMTDEGLIAVGGMFIFPDREQVPPNPTGCLLVWHQHVGWEGIITSFQPRYLNESMWMAHVWIYGDLDPWGRDFDGTEPYSWFFPWRYVPAVCAEDGECI